MSEAGARARGWTDPAPEPAPDFRVVPAEDFAAVAEATAEPILGSGARTALTRGGMMVAYGKGGGGKTTLEVNMALHLATGAEWLGLPVPGRVRALLIENEGPRGAFREKIAAKLASWDGPAPDGHLTVLEEPWARFSFASDALRGALVAYLTEHEVDVLIAGPVGGLGVEGGGTPEEVRAFIALIEAVRAELGHDLAAVFIHHPNKAGSISGAWEGIPDTLVHVAGAGPGVTRVWWEKARWGRELHDRRWRLRWTDGEGFELDETPEVTDDDIVVKIRAALDGARGLSANGLEKEVGGNHDRVRRVRDEMLERREIVNLGGGKGGTGGGGMKLFLAEDAAEQGPFAQEGANGRTNGPEPRAHPEGRTGPGAFAPSPDPKEGEGGANASTGPSATPDEDLERWEALASDEDWWCSRCELPRTPASPGDPHCHGHEEET